MAKKKRKPKVKKRTGRVLVTAALLAAVLLFFFASGFLSLSIGRHPTPIMLDYVGPETCRPWPLCQYSQSSASSLIAAAGVPAVGHIADTWQSWVIHLQDGTTQSYSSDSGSMPVTFQLAQSQSPPAWLDVTVPVQLAAQLQSYSDVSQAWTQQVTAAATLQVIVNGVQVGGTNNLNQPMTFTASNRPGDEQSWTFRVIFGPGVSTAGYTVSALNALNGLSSANIILVFTEIWTMNIVYTALPYLSGVFVQNVCGTGLIGYVNLPYSCQIGSTSQFYPPGSVQFQWTPGAFSGGASITAPTAFFVTCPGPYGGVASYCVSQASFSTVITTRNVSITIIASPTLTPILPNSGPPTGNSNQNGNTNPNANSTCKLTTLNLGWLGSYVLTLPAWMCGETFGINNVIWVLAIILFIIILLYVAIHRRAATGEQTSILSFNL